MKTGTGLNGVLIKNVFVLACLRFVAVPSKVGITFCEANHFLSS
jgi:hypothetical protein